MSEIKVGDVCSIKTKSGWMASKVKAINEAYIAFYQFGTGVQLMLDREGIDWERNIHGSLLPAGFMLVKNEVLDALHSNLHIAETAVFEQMIEIGDLTIEIDILKNELKDK